MSDAARAAERPTPTPTLRTRGHSGAASSRLRHARRALWAAAVLVVVAFVASTVPDVRPRPGYDPVLDGVLNNLAYAASAAVCWARACRASSYRRSWVVLALGLSLYGTGNIVWTVLVRTQDPAPFPSVADAFWLAFHPAAFVALGLIIRDVAPNLPVSVWLDGVIGGLAASSFAAAFVGPILTVTGCDPAAVITTLAYVVLDFLQLLVVAAVLTLFSWRPPQEVWFLVAGLVLFMAADAAYAFATAAETYQPGGLTDALWVLATVAVALAPGRAERARGVALPPWVLLGIPVTATLCALSLIVYDQFGEVHPVAVLLAAATSVVALARLIVTHHAVSRLEHSHRMALTDDLTGLGNRRAFYNRALEARWGTAGEGRQAALLLLDLDRFKDVNDSLGHHAGDDLLRQVATRLQGAMRARDDLLARLGGDEFAAWFPGADAQAAEAVAERMHEVLSPPFVVEGVTVRASASIGISLQPQHGEDVTTLLRCADIAMYRAKGERRGHAVYSVTEDAVDGHVLRTLEELRHAIQSRTLVVHYQPKVDARTLSVSGVEALVRWNHHTRGLLSPEAFLRLAEDARLMPALTDAVLEQALDQVSVWRRAGRDLTVAVNLSASSLADADLSKRIRDALAERGLPTAALQLEITEDLIVGDRDLARLVLTELRNLGMRIAVDDFGTGYSSLAYLHELPIDEVKLDRSFVLPMVEDPRAAAIVTSTIELAHRLGLTLVAEGVEDEATVELLASASCDEVQGYFFSAPLPAPALERWLDRRPMRAARAERPSRCRRVNGHEPAPAAASTRVCELG